MACAPEQNSPNLKAAERHSRQDGEESQGPEMASLRRTPTRSLRTGTGHQKQQLRRARKTLRWAIPQKPRTRKQPKASLPGRPRGVSLQPPRNAGKVGGAT